jgi:hypothetical protein
VLADDGTVWLNIGDSYAGGAGGRGDIGNLINGVQTRTIPVGNGRIKKPLSDGLKAKDLIGVPWMLAFALRDAGWYLRSDIIWAKPNPMPESVTDRPTKSHEYLFLLSKSATYYYDAAAIAERSTSTGGGACFGKQGQDTDGTGAQSRTYDRPQKNRALQLAKQHGLTEAHFDAIRSVGLTDTGKNRAMQTGTGKNTPDVQRLADEAKAALGGYYREFLLADTKNKRSVWTVTPEPYPGAHFAVMPRKLVEPCILAGSRPGDTVLDPFAGSGTVLAVAMEHGRRGIGCDLNPAYIALATARLESVTPTMFVA